MHTCTTWQRCCSSLSTSTAVKLFQQNTSNFAINLTLALKTFWKSTKRFPDEVVYQMWWRQSERAWHLHAEQKHENCYTKARLKLLVLQRSSLVEPTLWSSSGSSGASSSPASHSKYHAIAIVELRNENVLQKIINATSLGWTWNHKNFGIEFLKRWLTTLVIVPAALNKRYEAARNCVVGNRKSFFHRYFEDDLLFFLRSTKDMCLVHFH